MIEITLSTYLWGLAASIITEVLKFIPVLNKTELSRSLTSIVVVALVAWYQFGFEWNWTMVLSVLVFAFVNYKAVVQPVARAAGLSTQRA